MNSDFCKICVIEKKGTSKLKSIRMSHVDENNIHKAQVYSDLQKVPLTIKIKWNFFNIF